MLTKEYVSKTQNSIFYSDLRWVLFFDGVVLFDLHLGSFKSNDIFIEQRNLAHFFCDLFQKKKSLILSSFIIVFCKYLEHFAIIVKFSDDSIQITTTMH